MKKTILPIENIKEIKWINEKVYVVYKDGTKLISDANNTEFIFGYKNLNNHPLIDHCI
jgi:hypothetical protein